ncbi:hypothetical protein H920_19680 [Fukomys damarensis]|uniref:Uncharacterized protein n=1 Tax=Fukomys damarensis TaxID=885580 RepID=A0A091D7X0_FUKDA|nr:hypothetical protein H920_19680 [Fukomys damarensis]
MDLGYDRIPELARTRWPREPKNRVPLTCPVGIRGIRVFGLYVVTRVFRNEVRQQTTQQDPLTFTCAGLLVILSPSQDEEINHHVGKIYSFHSSRGAAPGNRFDGRFLPPGICPCVSVCVDVKRADGAKARDVSDSARGSVGPSSGLTAEGQRSTRELRVCRKGKHKDSLGLQMRISLWNCDFFPSSF